MNEVCLTVSAIYFGSKFLSRLLFFKYIFREALQSAASAKLCFGQRFCYVIHITGTTKEGKGPIAEFRGEEA